MRQRLLVTPLWRLICQNMRCELIFSFKPLRMCHLNNCLRPQEALVWEKKKERLEKSEKLRWHWTWAWTGRQFITGLTHRAKEPFMPTFTPMGNLESPIKLHVFGLWEEARTLRGNPHRHRENMKLHTEKPQPAGNANHRAVCCPNVLQYYYGIMVVM